MCRTTRRTLWFLGVLLACAVLSLAYSIPKEQLDVKKLYWGEATKFGEPAEIEYQDVVTATPEYKAIKTRKITRGTGRYWILMSQAGDRGIRAIMTVATDQGYDLVGSAGYLGSLKPPIPVHDITEAVIDEIIGKRETPSATQTDEGPIKTRRGLTIGCISEGVARACETLQ